MAIFARSFLRTRENTPLLDKVLVLFLVQSWVSMAAALAGFYAGIIQVTNAAIVLEAVIAFVCGILCMKKGYRPAGDILRQYLRRAYRHGRQSAADAERAARG